MHLSGVPQRQYGRQVSIAVKRRSRIEGAVVHLTATDPPFLDSTDPDGQALKNRAPDILAAARDALTPRTTYESYELELVHQRGTDLTVLAGLEQRLLGLRAPAPEKRTGAPSRAARHPCPGQT